MTDNMETSTRNLTKKLAWGFVGLASLVFVGGLYYVRSRYTLLETRTEGFEVTCESIIFLKIISFNALSLAAYALAICAGFFAFWKRGVMRVLLIVAAVALFWWSYLAMISYETAIGCGNRNYYEYKLIPRKML